LFSSESDNYHLRDCRNIGNAYFSTKFQFLEAGSNCVLLAKFCWRNRTPYIKHNVCFLSMFNQIRQPGSSDSFQNGFIGHTDGRTVLFFVKFLWISNVVTVAFALFSFFVQKATFFKFTYFYDKWIQITKLFSSCHKDKSI
jgi:hypothetical protein